MADDSLKHLAEVRAAFILRGSSFKGWCRSEGIDPDYAHKVVAGQRTGQVALRLRSRILLAAGVETNHG